MDAAWISTIHGMCARILRAHALEVGVDPSFAVLDEAAARPLLDAAVNEVLASANDLVAPTGSTRCSRNTPPARAARAAAARWTTWCARW